MTIINVEPTPITVANGGTGAATLTAHGVLLGEGTSAVAATAAMTNGQLLVGQTSADPLPKTVSGDSTMAASGSMTNTQLSGQPYQNIPVFGAPLPNVKFKRIVGSNLGTGDTDLYTVPSNRRLFVGGFSYFNPSAGNIAFYVELKVSSTYYRLTSTTTPSTGTGASNTVAIVLEAGDVLAVNTATNTGFDIYFTVVEFDNTATVRSPRLLGTSNGNNTIYTVPASTSAYLMSNSGAAVPGALSYATGNLVLVNDAGGTHNFIVYNVPSGGSADNTNKVTASASVGANVRITAGAGGTMTAGDFIVMNIDTGNAAQVCWLNVVEYPAV